MDRVRGVYLPILLLVLAGVMGVLGNMFTDEGRRMAARSQEMLKPERGDVAPRAEAQARRHAMINAAHEATSEGLVMYGCAALLVAGAGLLVVVHLRVFRADNGPAAT